MKIITGTKAAGVGFVGFCRIGDVELESNVYADDDTAGAWTDGVCAGVEYIADHPEEALSQTIDGAIDKGVDSLTSSIKDALRRAVRG